jgi:hypothetical protein
MISLDAITNEQVQKLKLALAHRAPKTVNKAAVDRCAEAWH